jgi:hypothetical protein
MLSLDDGCVEGDGFLRRSSSSYDLSLVFRERSSGTDSEESQDGDEERGRQSHGGG